MNATVVHERAAGHGRQECTIHKNATYSHSPTCTRAHDVTSAPARSASGRVKNGGRPLCSHVCFCRLRTLPSPRSLRKDCTEKPGGNSQFRVQQNQAFPKPFISVRYKTCF